MFVKVMHKEMNFKVYRTCANHTYCLVTLGMTQILSHFASIRPADSPSYNQPHAEVSGYFLTITFADYSIQTSFM